MSKDDFTEDTRKAIEDRIRVVVLPRINPNALIDTVEAASKALVHLLEARAMLLHELDKCERERRGKECES